MPSRGSTAPTSPVSKAAPSRDTNASTPAKSSNGSVGAPSFATSTLDETGIHSFVHKGEVKLIFLVVQFITGLCFRSQDMPNTKLCLPISATLQLICSLWLPNSNIKVQV